MEGMLKRSLVNKYLELCRGIAGNEQIEVTFGPKDESMSKYDPDRVQSFFSKSGDRQESSDRFDVQNLVTPIQE